MREEVGNAQGERYSAAPADTLIDLAAHPNPPEHLPDLDHAPAADYVKSTIQMERCRKTQEERERYTSIAGEYLEQSFQARIRAAQSRVMALRAREQDETEFALARQRAERDLEDLQRTQALRLEGVARLRVARHGPVVHVASCVVMPSDKTAADVAGSEADAALRRRVELAAEDVVVAYEEAQGRGCERVGHEKIGFDIRSLAPPDPQTGYRDPVAGVRRIEVKGRQRGGTIRLTTNEWHKAHQLGDTYWLYVVWDPLESPDSTPVMVQNPAKRLDHAKQEVLAARYYDFSAEAVEGAVHRQGDSPQPS